MTNGESLASVLDCCADALHALAQTLRAEQPVPSAPPAPSSPDRLLTVDEAATLWVVTHRLHQDTLEIGQAPVSGLKTAEESLTQRSAIRRLGTLQTVGRHAALRAHRGLDSFTHKGSVLLRTQIA